jgi:acetyl esterase/lipase
VSRIFPFTTLLLRLLAAGLACAWTSLGAWVSPATGEPVAVEWLEPLQTPVGGAKKAQPLVVYLKGLAAPRVGTEADAPILADFRAQGFLVAVFDYAHHPRARWPALNRDFAELRRQLHKKEFAGDRALDAASIFIVPAGYRLRRGVEYFVDGERRLALDIIYPARPAAPVGAILEFSCDNTDRMGNFSLQFCTDTLLEGAATEGFAVAMADHPVAAPYKGLDAMPDAAHKVKAAIRTLRAQATDLPLNGRIVTLGFSRGSGMALLAATTLGRREFEVGGAHPGVSSDVQGAVVLSGRFTYLDLRPDDAMIPRYEAAWGPRATHEEVWRRQGALDYLAAPTVPLFLSINATESPDALHQMEVLRTRLTQLGSPFVYHPEAEARGHRMPLAPEVLQPLLKYLTSQLNVAAPGQAASPPSIP